MAPAGTRPGHRVVGVGCPRGVRHCTLASRHGQLGLGWAMDTALTSWLPSLHLNVVLSSCGPFGVLPDGACSIVGGAADAVSQAGEMIQNPFRWLYHHTLGAPAPQQAGDPGWDACQADWTASACPKLIDQLRPSNVTLAEAWPRLYAVSSVSGVFIAMTCCAVRVVRAAFDEGTTPFHLIVDNIVRALVATSLLIAPTPQDSLLLRAMMLTTTASGRIAAAIGGAVSSAFGTSIDLGNAVGHIATVGFGGAGVGNFLVAIPILLVAIGFVYVLSLYLLRIVQLVFAVASAPLFVGLAAYDHRSRFVQWWLDLVTSAMLLPIILAFCGSLTAGIAMFFLGGGGVGLPTQSAAESLIRTLLACFGVLGGIWMTGKAVHGLAWRSFSHGGITGAATAVSTTVMALPNAAGDASSLLRLGGSAPRTGGLLETLSRPAHRDRPVVAAGKATGGETGAVVAAAAAGHAAAMAGDSAEVDAAVAAAAVADFSRHVSVAGVLADPAAQRAFNRAVGAAVGRFASDDEGRRTIMTATAHLDASHPRPSQRVAAYTAAVARDEHLGDAVAGMTLASLLHNQAPDLAPILRSRGAGG